MTLLSNDKEIELTSQFPTCVLLFLGNIGENEVLVLILSACLMFLLNIFLKDGENSKISSEKTTTTLRVFWLGLNLPLGLNGNHAFLAKAHPLQCRPAAKHCNPCKEVSILAGALAAGSVQKVMIVTQKLLTSWHCILICGQMVHGQTIVQVTSALFHTLLSVEASLWKWSYLIKGYSTIHCFLMVTEN